MPNKNIVSLRSIAQNIYPEWDLDEWFKWPPNMFALCSIILNRTGGYKLCLLEPSWWNFSEWEREISDTACCWIDDITDILLNKATTHKFLARQFTKDYYAILKEDWHAEKPIDINHIRVLGRLFKEPLSVEDIRIKQFIKAIILFTAVSDVACPGLGFTGMAIDNNSKMYKLFITVANLLLNSTGSLSTISKFHGIVLPKMRTPQAGLVFRSLSHHLTFHTTEVEVIWRTFPWLNSHKKNLNLICVPYPPEVNKNDFYIIENNYESVRYFKGEIQTRSENPLFFERLVDKISDFADTKNVVDLIVFPEMALTEKQYNRVLSLLANEYYQNKNLIQLPMVVAGVMKEDDEDVRNFGKDCTFHNEARMAVFFAGKWYDITQRKHHRWQLDRNQILQYALEGYFPTNQKFFEYSSVSQRRLTILTPNSWMALTSLICEDLARQEPVGEILRGIGPSLLMALLSDGPQLASRWSARYASVLADDPGTAVLSLTSKGMAERSQPLNKEQVKSTKTIVGLWKDMVKGWNELYIDNDSDAIMFSISSDYVEEFTLDGRTDNCFAPVFKMDTNIPLQVKFDKSEKINNTEEKHENVIGNWNDIRELSAALFTIDAIIDLLSSNATKNDVEKGIGILTKLLNCEIVEGYNNQSFFEEIYDRISISCSSPQSIGIEANGFNNIANDISECIEEIRNILKDIMMVDFKTTKELYDELINRCKESLKRNVVTDKRVPKMVAIAFLYSINFRLENWRVNDPTKSYPIYGMNVQCALIMGRELKELIGNYLRLVMGNGAVSVETKI